MILKCVARLKSRRISRQSSHKEAEHDGLRVSARTPSLRD